MRLVPDSDVTKSCRVLLLGIHLLTFHENGSTFAMSAPWTFAKLHCMLSLVDGLELLVEIKWDAERCIVCNGPSHESSFTHYF